MPLRRRMYSGDIVNTVVVVMEVRAGGSEHETLHCRVRLQLEHERRGRRRLHRHLVGWRIGRR